MLSHLPVNILGLRMTGVFSCSWSDDGQSSCELATEEKFIGANGITIDKDGTTVFVNDPATKSITVMKRDKMTQKLTKLSTIEMDFGADNIEYDDEVDEIIIGTIPDISAAVRRLPVIPGGMAIAQKTESGWKTLNKLNHDGTKLSQI